MELTHAVRTAAQLEGQRSSVERLVGTEPVIPLLEEDSASFLSVQAVDLLGALLLGIGAGLGGSWIADDRADFFCMVECV